TELAGTLELDPGYLSRLLSGLRQRGLVTARAAPGDRRHRHLALTARGRRTFGVLDARATSEIARLLEHVTEADQDQLLASLDAVMRLLDDGARTTSPPAIELRSPQPGDLGWVVQRHGEVYAQEYG